MESIPEILPEAKSALPISPPPAPTYIPPTPSLPIQNTNPLGFCSPFEYHRFTFEEVEIASANFTKVLAEQSRISDFCNRKGIENWDELVKPKVENLCQQIQNDIFNLIKSKKLEKSKKDEIKRDVQEQINQLREVLKSFKRAPEPDWIPKELRHSEESILNMITAVANPYLLLGKLWTVDTIYKAYTGCFPKEIVTLDFRWATSFAEAYQINSDNTIWEKTPFNILEDLFETSPFKSIKAIPEIKNSEEITLPLPHPIMIGQRSSEDNKDSIETRPYIVIRLYQSGKSTPNYLLIGQGFTGTYKYKCEYENKDFWSQLSSTQENNPYFFENDFTRGMQGKEPLLSGLELYNFNNLKTLFTTGKATDLHGIEWNLKHDEVIL